MTRLRDSAVLAFLDAPCPDRLDGRGPGHRRDRRSCGDDDRRRRPDEASPPRSSPTTSTTTTTTTTTTTLPPLATPPPNPSGIVNPIEARLPPAPPEGVGAGATGPVVEAYQSRLAELRFDPGPIDGQYGPAVEYAVQALQKFKDLPVTGVIGQADVDALNHFTYPEPLAPDAEPNRTEVDIARQTLTLYEDGQPRLLTTMSSGSGEHYCYETPKDHPTEQVCEVANTPGGRFTYYLFRPGWDDRCPRRALQPLLFQRRRRSARLPVRAGRPRLARLRPHPDAHRRVLPHARATEATRSTSSAAHRSSCSPASRSFRQRRPPQRRPHRTSVAAV